MPVPVHGFEFLRIRKVAIAQAQFPQTQVVYSTQNEIPLPFVLQTQINQTRGIHEMVDCHSTNGWINDLLSAFPSLKTAVRAEHVWTRFLASIEHAIKRMAILCERS